MHPAGLKLGEVTGFPEEGRIKVTPWDYLDRNYPGHVIGRDGKTKDGSEVLSSKEVFHEVPCFQDSSGNQYTPGFERRLKVGRSRFENRHAMRVFENGAALFFRELCDEEAYSSLGNRLFFEKIAPTLIRTLLPQREK
ncbi:MAG: hypothetical protein KGP28_09560 [Bdellovibrionales bacterium]|nr:hypothetical protein [Bdellovibrionales bacterium]